MIQKKIKPWQILLFSCISLILLQGIIRQLNIFSSILAKLIGLVFISSLIITLHVYVFWMVFKLFDRKFIQAEIRSKRLKGITIFAFVNFGSSIGSLINSIMLKGKLAAHQVAGLNLPSSYYYQGLATSIICFIVSLIICVGLLKLLKWSRILLITMQIIYFAYSIITYYIYIRPYWIPYWIETGKLSHAVMIYYIAHIIGFLLNIGIIYYFTRSKVKEQFK